MCVRWLLSLLRPSAEIIEGFTILYTSFARGLHCGTVNDERPEDCTLPMTTAERYEAYFDAVKVNADNEGTIPHCDSRILHHPSQCDYCDRPDLQAARARLGIALTGQAPEDGQVPCPADAERPPGASNDHRRWGGNRPTSSLTDPEWPEETFASRVFYGEPSERA